MSSYDLEVTGAKQEAERLLNLAGRAVDARPVMLEVRDLLALGVVEVFETQGSAIAKPWTPLSTATLERKRRQGLPSQPLVATGALLAALQGGRGRIRRASKGRASAGTSLEVAKFHMGGWGDGRQQKRGTPRRKVLGIPKHIEEHATQIVRRFLIGSDGG